MKRSFKVTIVVPEGATIERCREYIEDAVGTMQGSLKPYSHEDGDGDPMSELDGDKVRCYPITKKNNKNKAITSSDYVMSPEELRDRIIDGTITER